MHTSSDRPAWKTLLAFSIIYFAWGSTFLAIRVGVQEVPPLLLAAMRFLAAGMALYGWAVMRGEQLPKRREWASVSLLAFLIFVVDYGLLFWAEKKVPSGLAAVMLATIPAFTALAETAILRTQRLTVRLASALLIGIAGVAVLTNRTLSLAGAPIDPSTGIDPGVTNSFPIIIHTTAAHNLSDGDTVTMQSESNVGFGSTRSPQLVGKAE